MEKRKTLRSSFQENYTAVTLPADNRKGYTVQYIYYAPWYIWDVPQAELHRKKLFMAGLEGMGLVLFLVSVLLRTPLNNWKPVYFLTVLGFCAQVMEAAGFVDFLLADSRTTKMRYESIDRALACFTQLRMGIMVLASAVSTVYDIFWDTTFLSGLAILGYAVCAVLAWRIAKSYREIPFRTERNDAMEKIESMERAPVHRMENRGAGAEKP